MPKCFSRLSLDGKLVAPHSARGYCSVFLFASAPRCMRREMSAGRLPLQKKIARSTDICGWSMPPFLWSCRCLSLNYRSCCALSLWVPRRSKSYNFYVNLDDPDETYLHAVEAKAKLEQEGRGHTTAYLHHELNEVLALYQRKHFIEAHKKAEELHEKALEHRKSTSLLFFTSKTASHCCKALADVYEQHLLEKEERSRGVPTALAPPTSAVFQARRTILKLREDAQRYQGISYRVQQKPEMAFLRVIQDSGSERKKNEKKHQEGEKTERGNEESSASTPDGECQKEAYRHPYQSTSSHGGGSQGHRGSAGDTNDPDRESNNPFRSSTMREPEPSRGRDLYPASACRWGETSSHSAVDEDYEPFFGPRHQSQRRRPAFREKTHHLARQCVKRPVPK